MRLKGGDPFVFGRGGEELAALREAGAEVEVVPGITAALATAARLRMPLTHRGVSRSLHLITAHGRDDEGMPQHDWRALAAAGGTLAVYMGARTLPKVAQALLAAGMPATTPAIAVENATLPNERRIRRTLADIAQAVAAAGVAGPTLTLIGDGGRAGRGRGGAPSHAACRLTSPPRRAAGWNSASASAPNAAAARATRISPPPGWASRAGAAPSPRWPMASVAPRADGSRRSSRSAA